MRASARGPGPGRKARTLETALKGPPLCRTSTAKLPQADHPGDLQVALGRGPLGFEGPFEGEPRGAQGPNFLSPPVTSGPEGAARTVARDGPPRGHVLREKMVQSGKTRGRGPQNPGRPRFSPGPPLG
ncbi:collagen alpha-1(III) chain-like [Penaeus monodon]|uniref:collagen alpha-1(III) chain-like n=1 Tax=Penaeus monodon TaxID=6687 RepID=UPI0018A73D01|nr:collagen alpha-1(III) chain-like [Penaeus monodon]